MNVNITPAEIWAEYEKRRSENEEAGLYDTVKMNENFFIGKQWEGAHVPRGMEKPVFNILKRVISYFVSLIVSDDVAADISLFTGKGNAQTEGLLRAVSGQVEEIIENAGIKSKNRNVIRNAAVDGDSCLYFRYDPDTDTGQEVKGQIAAEVLDNTNVLMGNPQIAEIQRQPYLIVVSRRTLDSVREEAKRRGIPPGEIDTIQPDESPELMGEAAGNDKVTVLTKFYRKNGIVAVTKTTRTAIIQPATEQGYRRYPLAWLSWDRIKNSCYGQAAVTGLIPNQIFINKLFAMCMQHVRSMAFPKVIYNEQLLPGGWDNEVGAAIAVNGDPSQSVATGFRAPDMSAQVMLLIEKTIQYTRDMMGASDAALGNVRPDNTSAIIAVQKASAMPLELQRMAFYQFVEDCVRIFLDIMRVDYGVRRIMAPDENGEAQEQFVDFGELERLRLRLNVEIGASTYWSELVQVQTIDNLYRQGVIPDPETYLECIPDGYVNNKQKILAALKAKQADASATGLLTELLQGYAQTGAFDPAILDRAAALVAAQGKGGSGNAVPAM